MIVLSLMKFRSPVAIVGDMLKGSKSVASFQALSGAALVLSGFACISMPFYVIRT